MVFSSLIFICGFLPVLMLVYVLTSQRLKNLVLVIASLIFYGWGDPLDLAFIAAMLVSNYVAGLVLDRAVSLRRPALVGFVAGNLLVLIAFKYHGFLVENFNLLTGRSVRTAAPSTIPYLPLGISFVTFHIISYLIDIYRRASQAQHSFINFSLYICNFAQLIAGPIIRYHEISEQIENRTLSASDIDAGILRFTIGIAKKFFLANPIGAISDTVFALPPASYSPSWAWIAIVCYSLEIYFDFSAYTDMAIGLGRMFGFRFPENFNYPYRARSMQDFWRRWHMSLSRWFRDYVYIPLGGNRGNELATARNLWIVFLLVGAWHGASWNFIVWGAWHGLFLSVERLGPVRRALAAGPPIVGHVYALFVIMIGWVFFRSTDLTYALQFLGRLFALGPPAQVDMMLRPLVSGPMMLLVLVTVICATPLWPAVATTWNFDQRFPGLTWCRAALVVVTLILAYSSMTIEEIPPFIYFRF